MVKSAYITTIKVNDHRNPGQTIDLDIHQLDGGIIGIESAYTEEIGNHIANPYHDCQVVLLSDPQGGDVEPDPPLEDDELVGFLKILVGIDAGIQKLQPENRPKFLSGLSKLTALSVDRLDFLFGLAKGEVESLAFEGMRRALQASEEDVAAGRTRPAEDVFRDIENDLSREDEKGL
jgi:hypothetical protein